MTRTIIHARYLSARLPWHGTTAGSLEICPIRPFCLSFTNRQRVTGRVCLVAQARDDGWPALPAHKPTHFRVRPTDSSMS